MDDVAMRQVSEVEWEIPVTGAMRVPARVFASERLLRDMRRDRCLIQARNMATLPGVVHHVAALCDAHQGYGFPIGGVAAFDLREGVISPGGVGYDINCGVRMLTTNVPVAGFMKRRSEFLKSLASVVPSGVGAGGRSQTEAEIRQVLRQGAEWAVERGWGTEADLERTEEGGRMREADPAQVSERAIQRGLSQLGTLGSGNHFLEVQRIDEVFDEPAAVRLGLRTDDVTIMIHCGSRGLGHQVASDYIRAMEERFGIEGLADRELIYAPFGSEMGEHYLSAMNAAVNYAFCNRQMILHRVRETLLRFFPGSWARMVYDVCHNIAKVEEHEVDGRSVRLCVHRKGATRSFGPGRPEIPAAFRDLGQPVLIPGSMGTASYVMLGTEAAGSRTFGSAAHGAGRVESRTRARGERSGKEIRRDLAASGIEVWAQTMKGLVEEAPQAYKDIDEVARTTDAAGLARLVARCRPLAVMKG